MSFAAVFAEGHDVPWHQLKVAEPSQDPTRLIHRAFPALYEAAGRPADMAIFICDGDSGPNVFYFAPGAYGFAKCVHAAPCPPPSKDHLDLIAGEPVAWEMLAE